MASVLTDIALQLKGNLAFLLGLGGMFTIVKGLLTGLWMLPAVGVSRPSIAADAKWIKNRLMVLAFFSLALFLVAVGLYFNDPMASIDPDALKKAHSLLTGNQQIATGIVALIALLLVVFEGIASVLRYRLSLLAAKAEVR